MHTKRQEHHYFGKLRDRGRERERLGVNTPELASQDREIDRE